MTFEHYLKRPEQKEAQQVPFRTTDEQPLSHCGQAEVKEVRSQVDECLFPTMQTVGLQQAIQNGEYPPKQ